MRFRVRLRTRWSDEDTQGALNNAAYLTLLEEARFALFERLDVLVENRFPFVVGQTNVAFVATGRGGREVEVECATTRIGATSFTQAYRVREVASGAVWCEAEARLVCVDPRTGSKAGIPARLREALAGSSPAA